MNVDKPRDARVAWYHDFMRIGKRSLVGVAAGIVITSATFAAAWQDPISDPPGDNAPAPINVSATSQEKFGGLYVSDLLESDSLAVYGDAILGGASRYLNFGDTVGTDGYGIRDNVGTLQFKNSGGVWTDFGGDSGSLIWLASGNNIYNTNSGNVGIGVEDPGQKLDVSGTVRATAFLYSSDGRLKENRATLTNGLTRVLALLPVSFTWKEGSKQGEQDIGFIAQEVERVVPEVVNTDAEGMKSVDYARLIPILTTAIQEQQEEINALKADVAALKAGR